MLIEKAGQFHYTWIKDLNRLLNDESKDGHRKYFCERCVHGYIREDLLEGHMSECRGIGQTAVRVEMPEEGKNKLTFQNHHTQLPAPYIIYADFESLTTKIEGAELYLTKGNTRKTEHHEACSYCYIVVQNCFLNFPVEHWFCCLVTEPDFTRDISAIEAWLIDWWIVMVKLAHL